MKNKGAEATSQSIPPSPTTPPLLVLYDTRTDPGVLRYDSRETDISRAQRAVSRLLEREDVRRAWIILAIQEFSRPDKGGNAGG